MPKYLVHVPENWVKTSAYLVEADSPEDAVEKLDKTEVCWDAIEAQEFSTDYAFQEIDDKEYWTTEEYDKTYSPITEEKSDG